MTNPDFHKAIRRFWWQHWLHYPVQGLLMGAAVVGGSYRSATGAALEPRLATWPVLLALLTVVPVLGVVLYALYRRMRPNLRRPTEQNLRIYQSRLFLRNSLASLVCLPLLASYVFTHAVFDLAASAAMLLALGWQTAPSATTYQRWLLS